MFAKKNSVLEMPADAAASAGGGALGYAGFWARFAALLVDSAILMIVGIVLVVALSMALGADGAMIGNIIWVLAYLLYWPVMESSARQATFGKSLLGIEVTDLDGNRTSFVRALLRNLAKIISAIPFYIGFLLAAFTGRKQALHDMITSCLVVRTGPSNFLMAVVAAVAGLAIAGYGGYYYITKLYLPQQMESAMKGPGKDFEREMEKAMKGMGQDMAKEMERAMKEAERDMKRQMEKAAREAQKAPSSPPPAQAPAAPPATAPQKPESVALAPTPAKPAAPATKAAASPRPAPEAAPSAEDKPRPARRVVTRRPAAPPPAAEAAPPPATRTAKYNDVMTAVMSGDRAGAAEALDLGFWADRLDSNGVTPLMVAAMNGDAAMTQLLLKHGADPNRRGPGGSVLDYAGRSGDGRVVDVLRQAGAR